MLLKLIKSIKKKKMLIIVYFVRYIGDLGFNDFLYCFGLFMF